MPLTPPASPFYRTLSLLLPLAVIAIGQMAAQRGSDRAKAARPAREPSAAMPAGHKFGLPKPLPRTPGAVRIATYNTLNLFDHADDPSMQGEFDDIKTPTADERCRGLAAAIRALDADIIALQEVESLAALVWFRDTYLQDVGYKHLASQDVGYYRGVECSIMSRFPITSVRTWPQESLDDVRRDGLGWADVPPDARKGLTFQRSPILAEIQVNEGYALTVIALHHKAGKDFDHHREAEALQVVEYLDALRGKDPGRNVIVLGDFNAAPWDKSVRTYLRAGMIDTMDFRCTQGEDEARLYKTHESNRVLDLILVNAAAHRELVLGSPFVLGTLYPGDRYDYSKDPHPPGYASDHYPVAIELLPHDEKS
jgi:endonuclease/exonuclease/phosphatase family metal-dependent hydrolase